MMPEASIIETPPTPLALDPRPRGASDIVLEVQDLRVYFNTEEGEVRAVDGVSFVMRRGRITALVGESGCGKSVTAYSVLRLIQKPGRIVGGKILFHPWGEGRGARAGAMNEGILAPAACPPSHTLFLRPLSPPPLALPPPIDIAALADDDDQLYQLRGGSISMIFQEPMTALSPVHTVGNQMCEAILTHQPVGRAEARRRAIDMLGQVGIPSPERRIDLYPFEMSGGMRQRVVIAMALVCNPEILIADEPTTALDVTIQAQIMGLMKGLQRELNTSTLLITHDLGVVAQLADDVAVMYLGRIVERADVRTVMKDPRHPYTIMLLKSLPSLAMDKARLPSIKGTIPSLTEMPPGCPFHPRCPFAEKGRCDVGTPPPLEQIGDGHNAACLRVHELTPEMRAAGIESAAQNEE